MDAGIQEFENDSNTVRLKIVVGYIAENFGIFYLRTSQKTISEQQQFSILNLVRGVGWHAALGDSVPKLRRET